MFDVLPDNAVAIGGEHYITHVYTDRAKPCGVYEWHRNQLGQWCAGYIAFAGRSDTPRTTWTVVVEDPLTLTPSVRCPACGNHGWIRDGQWVDA